MAGVALRRIAIGLALIGGGITLLVVAMSVVSLIGRKLFSAPIPGDIEMLKMAIAVAVTAFLPLCEITDNHIRVELLGHVLPRPVNRVLLCCCHCLLALVAALICWRSVLLVENSLVYHSTSTMLAVPLWIPQSLMVPSLALLVVCALYRASCALSDETEVSDETDGDVGI